MDPPCVQRLYATTNLENATVTGDALNNNKPQAQAVLDGGGDSFFQLKNENRHAQKAAEQLTNTTPFCPHRRARHRPRTLRPAPRHIKVYPFEPLEAGLPGTRSLVVIDRTSTFDENEEPTMAFYTTTHPPAPGCACYFAGLARGHWGGSESRNYWVRDACMREDKTRSKNYNLNCNLSALRVCLVAIKADLHPDPSGPELQERCQQLHHRS